MSTIVTLTLNPCLDKNTSVHSVASEIKLRCEAPMLEAGGGGVNVSRAIQNMEGESLAIMPLGGGNGDVIRRLLERDKMAFEAIATQANTRENFIVFENSTSLQYRFGMPGEPLTDNEIETCIAAVLGANADYIVASGSLPPSVPDDFYAQLAMRVKKTSAHLIVDTSGAALERMVGSSVFLLKPNIHELEILSGQKFEGEEQMVAVARHLISQKMAQVLVISLGAQGAALISEDDYVQMKPPVVPIRSKVGAGDSMVGGMTYALAQGWSLRDAVRYGIAAGSAAVMNDGAELCKKADVERIYPKVKVLSD